MEYFLIAYYYSLPFLIAFGAAVGLIALGIFGINKPRLLVYPVLIVLLTVSGNTFGTLEFTGRSIYSRGSGLLFYPFVFWCVLAGLIWTKVSQAFSPRDQLACNLRPWFLAWAILLAGHLAVGLLMGEEAGAILSMFGLVNVLWMGVFTLFIVNAFNGESDVEELTKVILLTALAHALYGLVRWAAFGGDPANVYANRGNISVKLTFFDINDSLACLLGMVIAGVRLSRSKRPQGFFWNAVCWATLLLGPACIALSYRRTAWIGFVLAGTFMLIFLTSRHRWFAMLTVVPVTLVGMAVVAQRRLSQTKGAAGITDFFYDIVGRSTGALNQRQLELVLAWRDFTSHPITGVGSWGQYQGSHLIQWQQGFGAGDGAFLHSGLLHIALKSGILGFVLFAGLFLAFAAFVWRRRRQISDESMPLFVAGAAGILFLMPDMVGGTPIPQVRTMLVWGLCLALPYVAAQVTRSKQRLPALGQHPLCGPRQATTLSYGR